MSLNAVKVLTLQQLGEVAAELGCVHRCRSRDHESLLPAIEAYNRLD